MIAWMRTIAPKITGKRIEITSTLLVFSYSYAAITKTQTIPTFKTAVEYLKTIKGPTVKCLAQTDSNLVQPTNSTDKGHVHEVETLLQDEESNGEGAAVKEFRIILLGATGSGKSSTGNLLLNDKRFKTSCFAKAETKHSVLESKDETLNLENISQMCRIKIIDTPAVRDSGLTDQDVENEIERASKLSKPGPHAFLLCIPAPSLTNYYIDVIKRYEKYFDEDIYDFIVVAFTRYEQFMPEFPDGKTKQQMFNDEIKTAIAENDTLKRMHIMNKYIVLNKDERNMEDGYKTKKFNAVINIINENRNRRAESGKEEYSTTTDRAEISNPNVKMIRIKHDASQIVNKHFV